MKIILLFIIVILSATSANASILLLTKAPVGFASLFKGEVECREYLKKRTQKTFLGCKERVKYLYDKRQKLKKAGLL
jgi:hypothetical protein